ncbi:MAG: hypothetical protein JWM15_470, partial [Cryptosporangiaceae bacterium]|nr:hypothetical protein [Cryptosporangiaceae bacterium]
MSDRPAAALALLGIVAVALLIAGGALRSGQPGPSRAGARA